jgi:hypothetical protein
MERLAGRRIFAVGKDVFTWEDVVLAAHLWDAIRPIEVRITEGLAAEQHLGDEIPDDAVEELASEWRYERNLISADDTESWLAAREISVDEWLDHFRRAEARRRVGKDLTAIAKRYRSASSGIDDILFAEGMCSGSFSEVTERLAGRVAVHARAVSDARAERAPTKAKLRPALERLPRPLRQKGLFDLSGTECVKRAEVIAMMDLVYERFIAEATDGSAIAQEIEGHGLEWTRLDCRTLLFPSEEPAREVILLVRQDGLPIAKAASVAGAKVTRTHQVIEDLRPPLRDRLVAAQPGDLIGPVRVDGGFLVASVVKRVEPSSSDESIRARARERIERRIVQGEVDKRVTWHERF